jgi:hypothetical protein
MCIFTSWPLGLLYPHGRCWDHYLFCYLLTPRGWFLFEKLAASQLVKFPAVYGTRRFITAFKSARHSVLLLVFRNHLPELGHITKRVVHSYFGRKIIRIGMVVWNGSCELLRALKICLWCVGYTLLFLIWLISCLVPGVCKCWATKCCTVAPNICGILGVGLVSCHPSGA